MTDKLLTADQIDDFECRALTWLHSGDDDFDVTVLIVDALQNMLP